MRRRSPVPSGTMAGMTRLGAYVLPGDPVWMRSSLARVYDALDALVVPVPEDGLGWSGRPIPVDACLAAIDELDVRRIAVRVPGRWSDVTNPMLADTAQRQAALDAMPDVDWVLQLDNDELLPDLDTLLAVAAESPGVSGIEWPMRVLYRRLGVGLDFAAVTGTSGRPVYEYPGAVLVRPGATLVDARRVDGPVVRVVVDGDDESVQVRHAPADGETRRLGLPADAAILHNSWGRSPGEIWRKTRTWGHAAGWRGIRYYAGTWWPARRTWPVLRDFHPFARGLWPRLDRVTVPGDLLHPSDRG